MAKHAFMSLRSYQRPVLIGIHRGMIEERGGTYTVMFPRQSGKNEIAGMLVAGLLVAHADVGGSVVVAAPTFAPQALISHKRAMDIFRRFINVAGEFRTERNNIRYGRATATYLGANPEANVAGHTASVAIIADEAQDIDMDWFDRQFRPMAAATGAPTVMFGTTWNGQTMIEKAAAHNQRTALWRHYRVTWREVAKELAAYSKYVLAERERLGEGHHLFRTQYELLAGQPKNSLLTARQLESLRGGHPRLPGPVPGEQYVGGLDVGGSGQLADATVLTIGRVVDRRLEVVEHVAWQGATFGRLEVDLRGIQSHWQLQRIVVDATGIGSALFDQLLEADLPVAGFTFSRASKSDLGSAFIAALETDRLALYADDGSPEYESCLQELRECGLELVGGGRLAWGNSSGHDDYVASLMLCLHAARTTPPARVAVGRRRM